MLLDRNTKGDLIMENEKEMFRYGPDPYFIMYAIALLIPEVIGLATNGLNEESIFGKLPYWLLTCMVVSMLASLITGIAFVNRKVGARKAKITPLLIIAGVTAIAYTTLTSIGTALYVSTTFPLISLIIGFLGLTLLGIQRNNWTSLFFSLSMLVLLIISIAI